MTNFAKLLGVRATGVTSTGCSRSGGQSAAASCSSSLAVATLPKVANSRSELVLGIGAALVTFLVTAIFGVLARQVHEAASRGELRTRRWEYLSHAICLAMLVVGLWQLPNLGVGEAGMLLALLLLLAACLATASLGILATLVWARRVKVDEPVQGSGLDFSAVLTCAHFSLRSAVGTSHSLIVPSALPEARVLPSGLYATNRTTSVCPLRVARSLPVCTSHSLTVLSWLPEASVLPSGLNATDVHRASCAP